MDASCVSTMELGSVHRSTHHSGRQFRRSILRKGPSRTSWSSQNLKPTKLRAGPHFEKKSGERWTKTLRENLKFPLKTQKEHPHHPLEIVQPSVGDGGVTISIDLGSHFTQYKSQISALNEARWIQIDSGGLFFAQNTNRTISEHLSGLPYVMKSTNSNRWSNWWMDLMIYIALCPDPAQRILKIDPTLATEECKTSAVEAVICFIDMCTDASELGRNSPNGFRRCGLFFSAENFSRKNAAEISRLPTRSSRLTRNRFNHSLTHLIRERSVRMWRLFFKVFIAFFRIFFLGGGAGAEGEACGRGR